MKQEYLTGLVYDDCGKWDKKLCGLFVISGIKNNYYYISDYNTLQNRKQSFFNILQKYQKEIKREWELHHIIEKQHLKHFYSQSELDQLYDKHWPCILIHKGEHYCYNSLLHRKEPEILFLEEPASKAKLLANIKKMYGQAYIGNPILSTIAQNVLKKVKIIE